MFIKIKNKINLYIRNIYTFLYAISSPFLILFFPYLALPLLKITTVKKINDKLLNVKNPLSNYNISQLKDPLDFNDEINIIISGNSIKKLKKKINKNLPTFFINPREEPNFIEFEKPILATSDLGVAQNILGFGKNRRFNYPYFEKPPIDSVPLLFVEQTQSFFEKSNFNKKKCVSKEYVFQKLHFDNSIKVTRHILNGFVSHKIFSEIGDSATNIIIFLIYNFKKVNIYGWDFYRKKTFNPRLNFICQIYLIWILGLYTTRANIRTYFSGGIYTLIVVFGLKNMSFKNQSVNICGHLSSISNEKKIIDKLLLFFNKTK